MKSSSFRDAATSVSIDPNQRFIADDQWHKCQPTERKYAGKTRYVINNRVTRRGTPYQLTTFYNYAHGGMSASHCSLNDTVRQAIPVQSARSTMAGQAPKPPDYARRNQCVDEIWRQTYSLTDRRSGIARQYLIYRGLGQLIEHQDLPDTVRFHPTLEYWQRVDGKTVKIGSFPALVAAITASDNTVVSLHRTYLRPDGRGKASIASPKKIMPTIRPKGLHGAAIRLYEPGTRLAIAEGIETALAIRAATGIPVWSCISTFGMKTLIVPESVQEIIICADHDTRQTGEKSAYRLARRLSDKTVKVVAPSNLGADWLDILNKGAV